MHLVLYISPLSNPFVRCVVRSILHMIVIILNLLRYMLLSSMWSVLVNSPCGIENNVYSVVGWNILWMSVRLSWLVVMIIFTDFCWLDLIISERGLLKYPTGMVALAISPFSIINFCFVYFETFSLGTYTFRRTNPFISM